MVEAEKRKRRTELFTRVFLLAVLVALPAVVDSYSVFVANIIGIYIIVNAGLDILYGYSGQISIGQAGFYAIGAYATALLSLDLGVPVFMSIPAGALLAALAGVLVAVPSVRLVHHFLAMVTIGFGEIVRLILHNGGKYTGGPDGIAAIPCLRIGAWEMDTYGKYYYVVFLSVLVFLVVKENLVDSRVGRALVAIRENPVASSCVGIDVPKYKVMAFAVGAFYAGFGGALYAHLVTFVSPETFSLDQSVAFLTMVLLGGSGCFWGPIVGTVIIHTLWERLQQFTEAQMAIYGLVIILVLFFMPRGIVGRVSEILRNRQ